MRIILVALFLLSGVIGVFAQTITGKITDAKGQPIVNATVQEVGTANAAATDSAGTFKITLVKKNSSLRISAIGFIVQTINVKNRTSVNTSLAQTQHQLSEVVVTGYSTARKMAVTGSVHVLQGSVPGVSVKGTSGFEQDFNTEDYDPIHETGFRRVTDHPLSTFSIDVDAASYSNVRRIINSGQLPGAGAVRIEEMINYFKYTYKQPDGDKPFSFTGELSSCPWNERHKLLSVGLQGKTISVGNIPPSNLVFLVDVSGSMNVHNKLPLVKSSLKLLVDQLRPQDQISIVVYAGAAGLVLPATNGSNKMTIKNAIDNLQAGGSTAGGEGILLAYKTARENFIKGGNNRIVLCTDGDFNVGVSSNSELEKIVEKEKEDGVFLTVLGYGIGNYKDNKMQIIADKGNGNHAYIDTENEAKKVLVNEFGGTLFTIAKDVKMQLEFNPNIVQAYRLIGYENRMLNKEDFNDDKKDAGELGSGHTVTALYEIIPRGVESEFLKDVDALKYQVQGDVYEGAGSEEIVTIKFRHKEPDGKQSKQLKQVILNRETSFDQASEDFRFAAAVAEFGMLLRDSPFKSSSKFSHVTQTANAAMGNDEGGYKKEFVELVGKAEKLSAERKDIGKNK